MKKIQFTILLSAVCLMFSCKNELRPQDSAEVTATDSTTIAAAEPPHNITASEAITQPQTEAAPAAPGMNPAHGEPGHRCDIAVGAPLNSPATNTVQPQTGQAQTAPPSNVTTSSPPQKAAKGMNPAHGEAGHRCDIAVGAPLNSPAAANPAPTATTPTPLIEQKATPTLLTPNKSGAVAAGMNPAHGEPGHKCDVPVGSPLPKS